MMNSTRTFFRNFIKYFLYVAVFAQIGAGLVYFVCHFGQYSVTSETEDIVHTARTLVFDEYTGVLYPLFVRVFLFIQNLFGIGYYGMVYAVQTALLGVSAYYFFGYFFKGKNLWLTTLFFSCHPMCLQTALMVSPLAFKGAMGLFLLGAMIRLWREKWNLKTFILLLAAYFAAALNVTDDLYLWLIPIGILMLKLVLKREEKKTVWKRLGIIFAVVLAFFVAFLTLHITVEKGARGRMQRTVESVLFQKTLWPELSIKWGFLAPEIWQYISQQDALDTNSGAEAVVYVVGPMIDRGAGFDRANELYMESFLNQLSYNKRAIFENVSTEFVGYLLMPYSAMWFLSGQEGSAIGSLYSLMSKQYPMFVYGYWCISMVSVFLLSFAALLKAIKEKIFVQKKKVRLAVSLGMFLIYQALWYAIANVQGVDYRYEIIGMAVWFAFALYGVLIPGTTSELCDTKEENRKRTRKLIWIVSGVALACICCIALVSLLGKGYKKNSMLEGKNIVCFADSIWGSVQDDTGIAAYVEKMTGATVINYAISGTTASETYGTDAEDACSFGSLMQMIEILENGESKAGTGPEHIRMESLSEADYIVIAYGLNDYFSGISISSDDKMDKYTYEGALRYAVSVLREHFPNTRILLIGQTYCQFYAYGVVEEDSDTRNLGGGVGMDYVLAAKRVAEEYDLLFLDQYSELPMNEWNGKLYLKDATHLNERGRMEYAKIVSDCLLKDYQERNAR